MVVISTPSRLVRRRSVGNESSSIDQRIDADARIGGNDHPFSKSSPCTYDTILSQSNVRIESYSDRSRSTRYRSTMRQEDPEMLVI